MADAKTTLSELITGPGELVQGVEATLLQRRRVGGLGLVVGLLGAVLQVIAGVFDRGYFKKVTELGTTLTEIVEGKASPVILIGLLGFVLFAVGLAVYLLLRWTRVLQKDSEEPFRYTVSMDKFKRIETAAPKDAKPDSEDKLALLHYDLRERLNARIGRFSLLENRPAAPTSAGVPTATDRGSRPSTPHIHVTGEYVLRQDRNNRWLIHVMPTVQLGPVGSPLTMAHPVRYDLGGTKPETLETARYEQIVERVYSSVATEVYSKIEADVRTKIEWFPTRHLRAVALFHEAEDMARSNTVDAYDRALNLYRSAQRFFDLALLRDKRRWLVKLPLIWRMNARYLQMRARIQIGYVRCQIYRQMIALQSGRKPNAIYEGIWRMDEVIEDLQAVHARFIDWDPRQLTARSQVLGYFTFRRDRFLRAFMRRPLEPDFERQRRILFDACTVAALAHAMLGNLRCARERLDEAVAVDPSLRERDPVHLLTEAEISPDPRRRVKLLQEATDLSSSFQIAQYRLAQAVDLLFRDENQFSRMRVTSVIGQFDEVLRINPGNIAAIAGKGYLYWLTGQGEEAERCFREGIEFKSIVRETSIAELTYGLARTLAEQGKYDEAFDQFMQSVAVDPDVAAWTIGGTQSRTQGRYYDRINPGMVQRYADYAKRGGASPTDSVHRMVRVFMTNDLANARINDYIRNGNRDSLTQARDDLEKIGTANQDNPVVHFNLAVAYDYDEQIDKTLGSIDRVVKLSPGWQAARVAQIRYTVWPSYLDELDNRVQRKKNALLTKSAQDTHSRPIPFSASGAGEVASGGGATMPSVEESSPTSLSEEDLSPEQRERLRGRRSKRSKIGITTQGTTLGLSESPPTPHGSTEIDRLKSELRDLEQQRANVRQSYRQNLRNALCDVTRNSRLWHLLVPGTTEAHPIQWIDQALALSWSASDGPNGRVGNAAPAPKQVKWWRRRLARDPAVLHWEQLDGSDVQALKSLIDATTKSAGKEHEDNWKALKTLVEAAPKGAGKEHEDNWKALKALVDATTKSARKEHEDNWEALKALVEATTNAPPQKQSGEWDELRSLITRIEQSKANLEKCARLNLFFTQRFMREDLDLCLLRRSIRDALRVTPDPEIDRIVAHTVALWLEEDPWHYFALKWWIGWLDPDKLVALGQRQVYSQARDPERLRLVVDHLLGQIAGSSGRLSDRTDELYTRGLELALQAAQVCVEQDPPEPHSYYNLGRAWSLHERWADAVAAFDKATQKGGADSDLAMPLMLARVRAHEKYADDLQGQGLSVHAFEAYLKLARVDPTRRRSYDKLLPALAKLASRTQRTGAAARVRELLREELDRDGITENRRKETQDLLRRLQIAESFGSQGLSRLHIVTPIAIEVASNMVDLVAKENSELQSDLETEITAMKERIQSAMGVRVPGLRFRGNEGDLTPGSYIIMLGEIPLVMGNQELTEQFYQGSLDAPTIARLHPREQVDPLTNRKGWWLPEAQAHNLGLESDSLVGPRTFMMRHVEAVLRSNLADFLGHSELDWMIEDLNLPPEQQIQNPVERSALITALRSLLLERVPIAALAEIVAAWPAVRSAHPHLRAQVEALRSLPALRAHLPGNDGKHQLFEIGPKFESAIRNDLHDPDHAPLLGLTPELCQEMLAEVRNENPPASAALVINDAPLRPHLRELVKLEWPFVPVLAAAELGVEAMASPRTRIELG